MKIMPGLSLKANRAFPVPLCYIMLTPPLSSNLQTPSPAHPLTELQKRSKIELHPR